MEIRLAADLQMDSIVDGKGIRTVIWTQGCKHKCPKCHNPETWSFNGGSLVDVKYIIDEMDNLDGQDGITFSGGDPFYQPKECAYLAKHAHSINLNVWCYTGFTYEQLIILGKKNKDIMDFLEQIDVLIDGPYIDSLHSLDILYRGSKNQRIIDVQKSLEDNKVIELDYDKKEKKTNFGRSNNKLYI